MTLLGDIHVGQLNSPRTSNRNLDSYVHKHGTGEDQEELVSRHLPSVCSLFPDSVVLAQGFGEGDVCQ